jgi:hypothetical protein
VWIKLRKLKKCHTKFFKAANVLEFPQNVISKDITSPKVPICPIFEKNERTVL